MGERKPGGVGRGLALLAALWGLQLVLLGVLQLAGTGWGLDVWPNDEDFSFIELLRTKPGVGLPNTWWQMDGRNPLASWWYVAASPALLHPSGYGMFAVRRAADLLLAAAVYLLVRQLGRGRQELFAVCCGVLVLLWNFCFRLDCVAFFILGAVSLSVLALACYCAYLDGGRRRGGLLALSLLCYLAAVGTYSLQLSAFLAVPVLALVRPGWPGGEGRAWGRRLAQVAGDTGLFAGVAGLFLLIWLTASRNWFSVGAETAGLWHRQLVPAVLKGLWHPYYTMMVRQLGEAPLARGAAPAAAGLAFFGALFWAIERRRAGAAAGDGAEGGRREARAALAAAGYTVVAAGALAAMILATEATSAVWAPGARSPMVQQAVLPMLYASLLFAAAALVAAGGRPRAARATRVGGAAVLAALALVGFLHQNRRLTAYTDYTRSLARASLRDLAPWPDGPTTVVVTEPDGPLYPLFDSTFMARYLRRQTGRPDLHVVFVPSRNHTREAGAFLPAVVFGPDGDGVVLPGPRGRFVQVPYGQVLFVHGEGDRLVVREQVGPDDLAKLDVRFQRTGPAVSRHPLTGQLAGRMAGLPASVRNGW